MRSSDQPSFHINFLELETTFLILKRSQTWLWHSCPASDREYNGDSLSEQGGRDQIQEPGLDSLGDYSVVCEVEDLSLLSTFRALTTLRWLACHRQVTDSCWFKTLDRMVCGP